MSASNPTVSSFTPQRVFPSRNDALKIAFCYALVGALWILGSGKILHHTVKDAELEAWLETLKGWFFVGVTAGVLGWALDRYFRDIRRAARSLLESETKWRSYVENAPVGVLISDVKGEHIEANHRAEEMLDHEPGGLIGIRLTNLAASESREDFQRHLEALSTQGHATGEFKLQRKRGGVIWASVRTARIDPDRFLSIFENITGLKQVEESLRAREQQLRLFVEYSPAAIAMLDTRLCYLVVSRRWLSDYRLEGKDILGRSHYEIFPEIPERWKEIHRRCLTGAVEKSDEDAFPRADGSLDWVRWEIRPWHTEPRTIGGLLIFSELITARKLLEDERREKTLLLEAQQSEIKRLNRLYATLSQLNQAIVRCRSREKLFEEICRVMLDFGQFRALWIGWRERQDGELTVVAHRSRGDEPAFIFPGWRGGCGVTQETLRTANPALCNAPLTDARSQCCREVLKASGIGSCAAFPLRLEGNLQGVFSLCADELGFFNTEETRLLEEIANDISYALERLHEQEQRRKAEEALRYHEALLKETGRIAKVGGWEFDPVTGRGSWTEEVARIHDLSPATAASVQLGLSYFQGESRIRMVQAVRDAVEKAQPYDLEVELVSAQGVRKWVRTIGHPLVFEGKVVKVYGSLQDITERRRVENALRESERLLHTVMDLVPHFLFAKDSQSRHLFVNRACAAANGLSPEQMVGLSDPEFLPDRAQAEAFMLDDREVIDGGKPKFIAEERLTTAAGQTRILQTIKIPFTMPSCGPGLVGVAVDITELKQAETALRTSLAEKTALLKEVHHRVKNNLQVVTSLLNLQSRHIKHPAALAALRDTQSRVRSMALLHETLYREGDMARVNCEVYLGHLCVYLKQTYGLQAEHIQLVQNIAAVQLGLDEAIPCGLIVNELISNAYKHAFPGRKTGTITISLRPVLENRLTLTVQDDGVGLPANALRHEFASMGMELVQGLANQINGALKLENQRGTRIEVTFLPTNRHPEAS